MRSARLPPALAVLLGWLAPALAWACPDCPTSRAVRAHVFGAGFATTLAETLAPFVVIALAVAAVQLRSTRRPGAQG